jgi:aspartate aminotransferase
LKKIRIAARLSKVAPSATFAMAQRAKELQAKGLDVVDLTTGEPDMQPPPHVIAAAKAALDRGATKYTQVPGLPELRDAIRARIKSEDAIEYTREQILVSSGAKQSIYNALESLVEAGDEVLILAPYWVSYRDMVLLAGGEPIIIDSDEKNGFLVSAAQLEAAIGPRTRLLIINSPSNPAGATYDRAGLKAIAAVLERHPEVLIISDDIYRDVYFGQGRAPTLLEVAPSLADRALIVSGCSKSYAMTGFRIGWAAGPKDVISAMSKLQGQSTSNASTPAQYAAIAAITGDQSWGAEMVRTFDRRRKLFIPGLNGIPGMSCFDPGGAFYALPSCEKLMGRKLPGGAVLENTDQLCDWLLDKHHTVCVPGGAFGKPHHFRMSFATDEGTLEKALSRLAKAVSELS